MGNLAKEIKSLGNEYTSFLGDHVGEYCNGILTKINLKNWDALNLTTICRKNQFIRFHERNLEYVEFDDKLRKWIWKIPMHQILRTKFRIHKFRGKTLNLNMFWKFKKIMVHRSWRQNAKKSAKLQCTRFHAQILECTLFDNKKWEKSRKVNASDFRRKVKKFRMKNTENKHCKLKIKFHMKMQIFFLNFHLNFYLATVTLRTDQYHPPH